MGFKHYEEIADIENVKKLIRYGGRLFGSVHKFSKQLSVSRTHVYRWYNGESNMSLKSYKEIYSMLQNEKERKEVVA